MEDFNLHLTGDIHAITAAHNLCAAAIDARILHEAGATDAQLFERIFPKGRAAGSSPGHSSCAARSWASPKAIPTPSRPRSAAGSAAGSRSATITWRRVLDTSDRFSGASTVGMGSEEKGFSRETGFDIAGGQ